MLLLVLLKLFKTQALGSEGCWFVPFPSTLGRVPSAGAAEGQFLSQEQKRQKDRIPSLPPCAEGGDLDLLLPTAASQGPIDSSLYMRGAGRETLSQSPPVGLGKEARPEQPWPFLCWGK